VSLIIDDLHRLRRIMMNPKDGGARTEVGPHNMIEVAMEHLPEAERITPEKQLRRKLPQQGGNTCVSKKHAPG
jgi:hypothetical protein